MWLDANTLTLNGGDPVAAWNDVSGNTNNAQQTVPAEQPSFIAASTFNSYPAVQFSTAATSWMQVADDPILDNTSSINYFAVVRPSSLSGVNAVLSKRVAFSGFDPDYAYSFFFNSTAITLDINTGNNRFSAGGFSTGTDYILSFGFDGARTASTRSTISSNGAIVATGNETSTSIVNSSSPVTIGTLNAGDGRYFNGNIAEIIHFNRELNEAESIIVNNYLSAKYDIAIPGTIDLFTQDDNANGDFDHDVAGIGRASSTDIHDDSQGTGIIRINNPTGLSNGEYLFWGRDLISGTEPTFAFDSTANITKLNTTWRVSEIGTAGTVDFTLDLSGLPSYTLPGSCADFVLIVDTQSDFNSGAREEYPLTISGTTASTTLFNANLEDGDYFTIAVNDVIVYDGTSWFNGSGTINRPDSTDSCKDLLIKSGATIAVPNDFHVNSITLESGARLNIGSANKVTVENELNLATGSVLNLRTDAQLLQNNTGVDMNTGDGELIIRQQGTGSAFNYNYWSSPVNVGGAWTAGDLRDNNGGLVLWTPFSARNPDPSTTPITLSSRWLYSFNATTNNYDQWSYIGTTVPLLPGFGYSMKGSGTGSDYEFDFRGSPNNGDLSLTVASGGSVLIGNPYPSTLDVDQFLSDNSSTTTATAYFYEQFASNASHFLVDYQGGYATRNMMMGVAATADASGLTSGVGTASKPAPDQFAAVAQGFFVQSTGTSINFNNAQRGLVDEATALGSVFYAAPGSSLPAYNVDVRPKITFAFEKPQTFKAFFGLGYDQRATHGVDNGFDALDFNDNVDHVLWEIAGDSYVIQSLQNVNVTDILPLEVSIENPGVYELSIESSVNIPPGMEVYLHDAVDGLDFPLHLQPAILNLGTQTNNTSRFSIRFQPTSTLAHQDFEKEDVQVDYINNDRYLEIANSSNLHISQVQIYNMSGQSVYSFDNPDSYISLELTSGVYLVQLNLQNGFKVTRKVLVQ